MAFLFDLIPRYLTMDEGADFLSQLLGHPCSVRNLLTLAENRHFGLFVGVDEKPPFVSVTRIKHPSPSNDDFYMFPLSTANIQELLACGQTLITQIMVYGAGKDFGKEYPGWEIAPGHTPPKVRLDQCRVSRDHLKRWVKLNGLEPEQHQENKHIGRILSALDALGYNKHDIKRGEKNQAMCYCIEHAWMSQSVFNKNWQKASKAGLISHEMKEKCQPRK